MPAAFPLRDADEGMPSLRRRVARLLVLAGGTIAAWLLASGIASATETGPVAAAAQAVTAPESSLLGPATDPSGPSGANGSSDPGGSAIGGIGVLPAPTHTPLAGAADLLTAQHAVTDWSGLSGLAAPFELPVNIRLLPGAITLPRLPDFGTLPTVRPPAHPMPITPPSGDRHQPGLVAAAPAVAADATPAPAARPSAPIDLAGTGSVAPAATPDQPPAPVQEKRPCPLPSSVPAAAPAGGPSAVEIAPGAGPITGCGYVAAPRRGPTMPASIAEQPGTTPD